MRILKLIVFALAVASIATAFSHRLRRASSVSSVTEAAQPAVMLVEDNSRVGFTAQAASQRYSLDASQSRFIAHALAGGLFWFKGHDHLVAVRDFSGEAQLNPDSLATSSLEIVAKTASMEETSSVFTAPQKLIINKELRDIVLLPDQYPEITFKSTSVRGATTSAGQYDLKISGNLTLHGATRPVTIPTRVTVTGKELRAQGEFSINRSDFGVKATSAFHGLVRVRDKVKFEFDIVGRHL